jgi:hypothetical protein
MIDVHCHLTEEPLYTQLKMVVEEARQAGVAAIITSGIGYEDCVRVLEISDNTYIYPTLGIEPYELTGYEMVLDLIVKNRDRVAGVGEVGLDYYIGARDTRETRGRFSGSLSSWPKASTNPWLSTLGVRGGMRWRCFLNTGPRPWLCMHSTELPPRRRRGRLRATSSQYHHLW